MRERGSEKKREIRRKREMKKTNCLPSGDGDTVFSLFLPQKEGKNVERYRERGREEERE